MGKSALSSHLFVKMPDNDGTIRQALAPPPDIARNSIEVPSFLKLSRSNPHQHTIVGATTIKSQQNSTLITSCSLF